MFFERVSLPDELRIALEEGRLVIFAGAGVSFPPPSNLPTFNGLASRIAGGKSVEGIPADRFLSNLERELQTNVHAAASKILYGKHTKPTLLHKELLRLFREPARVRLVTTNFDNHFSDAAQQLFRKVRINEFCAPALPLGDDFSGLVYLHGSARISPTKLVLTDRDFGAAYLTRGWARDFLVSLFSRYTVLFVGYSHNDVTTTYLAQGLDPSQIGQRRWALVPSNTTEGVRENWRHLDISVTSYPIDPDNHENPHQALTTLFTQWANHTTESIFARAKRVKAIAKGLPPEGDVDSSYLHYCLSTPRLAQDFCNAIRHPAWVGWMHDRGYFNSFFTDTQSTATSLPSQHILAHWLCSDVRRRFPNLLLDLLRQHNQQPGREFSQRLAWLLWVEHDKKPDPHFATWIAVLLSHRTESVVASDWAYLLKACRIPDHLGVALGLFEVLTTPTLQIRRGWRWSWPIGESEYPQSTHKASLDYEIAWPEESRHSLTEAWKKVFEPHLSTVADCLSTVVEKQLTQAYLLLRGAGKSSKHYDQISGNRSSIAPHEQNESRLDECLHCLIDILRGILDHWIDSDSSRASVQVDLWWSTGFLLFQRLAAYAYSRDPQYSADVRIQWVLQKAILFRSGMKKEVFDILASSYSQASKRVREKLLHKINGGYREPGAKKLDERTLVYEQFNMLKWLQRSDPECSLVKSSIAVIHSKYPRFMESSHSEFESWHSTAEFTDPTEEFNFELILSKPPIEFIDELLAEHRDPLNGHLRCLPTLFTTSKAWTEEVIRALSEKSISDEEIWNGVFSGLRDAVKSVNDWRWIVGLIEKLPRESAIFRAMAHLISRGFAEHQSDWEVELADRATSLMDTAWTFCESEDKEDDDSYGDWLTKAINHFGGWMGEFWVHYCSHTRKREAKQWQGIPVELKSSIIQVVQGTSRDQVHARVALTPWIGYFYSWDHEFTSKYLVPLLDWNRDPVVAQQSWSVLLNYKRGTSKEFEAQLLPFYQQCAEQITRMLMQATEKSAQFNQDSLHRLGFQLAILAVHVITDPIASGFFRDFLPLLPEKLRSSLAIGIGDQLKRMEKPKPQGTWDAWLREYLDQRLMGVPVALSTEETKYMVEWCLYLGPVFPEAIDRIVQMPLKAVSGYSIATALVGGSIVDEFPLAACRLMIAVLPADEYFGMYDALTKLQEKFKDTIRVEPEYSKYEELLYLRGWNKS